MRWIFESWCGVLLFLAVALPVEAGKEADEALLLACERQRPEMAAKALKDGADPNAKGTERESPALHIALGQGNKEVVELLVKAGADVQAKGNHGDSILHAISGAYSPFIGGNGEAAVSLMHWVLDRGISVNVKNDAGETPLEVAAGTNYQLVRVLLERGAVASLAALTKAMALPSRTSVDLLLKAGVDPKAILPDGRTMMHVLASSRAAPEQKAEIVGLMDLWMAQGVEIDRPDAAGRTPLLVAASVRQAYGVDWLLNHGANAKAVDALGRSALMLAAESGEGWYDKIIDRLFAAGCPVNAVDKEGRSALDRSVVLQDWDRVFQFFQLGGVPAWPREVLRDALLAWREKPANRVTMRHIVRTLLPEALKVPSVRIDGRPLLQELVFLGDSYLLDRALHMGAKPDEQDAEGHTALMWAAAFKAEEMKALLIKAGAAKGDEPGMNLEYFEMLAADSIPAMSGAWEGPEWKKAEGGALGQAIARQATEVAGKCLDGGAKVEPGMLISAVQTGNIRITNLLLAHGANLAEVDPEGNTPAHLAAQTWRREMLESLIKAGADLNLKNTEGRTVVEEAKAAGYVEWAAELTGRSAK